MQTTANDKSEHNSGKTTENVDSSGLEPDSDTGASVNTDERHSSVTSKDPLFLDEEKSKYSEMNGQYDSEFSETGTFEVTVRTLNQSDEYADGDGSTVAKTPFVDSQTESSILVERQQRKRKARRGYVSRAAHISDDRKSSSDFHGLQLPLNQYETTLTRRAIRKNSDEGGSNVPPGADSEEYGDTSLGMKLTVVSGRVIVQCLNSLSDGRASPAQLSGLIQRGDVLMAINGQSLVNLPVHTMMRGLSPLSTPNANGVYQRCLHLQLECLGGLELLRRDEIAKSGCSTQQLSDQFSLFPMVDQLSGLPLFDTSTEGAGELQTVKTKNDTTGFMDAVDLVPSPSGAAALDTRVPARFEIISRSLAGLRQRDRKLFTSGFFILNKRHPRLLRCDESTVSSIRSAPSVDDLLSKDQVVERGKRAILGACALANQAERIDNGKDSDPLQSFTTTLSLCSRARSRRSQRRYGFDSASLPLSLGKMKFRVDEDESAEGPNPLSISMDPSASVAEDEENEEIDEVLLNFAANDCEWRKQLLHYLRGVGNVDGSNEEMNTTKQTIEQDNQNESRVENFSNFLLGESLTNIISKRKKSKALPAEEVTGILFNLAIRATATAIPEEIGPYRLPRPDQLQPESAQVSAVSRFLLEEALPAWTSTFKPLPWDQRRVLWPLAKHTSSVSSGATTLSDDQLTLDSFSTGIQSLTASQKKRKNLREQIEELELDAETRDETYVGLTLPCIVQIR